MNQQRLFQAIQLFFIYKNFSYASSSTLNPSAVSHVTGWVIVSNLHSFEDYQLVLFSYSFVKKVSDACILWLL